MWENSKTTEKKPNLTQKSFKRFSIRNNLDWIEDVYSFKEHSDCNDQNETEFSDVSTTEHEYDALCMLLENKNF